MMAIPRTPREGGGLRRSPPYGVQHDARYMSELQLCPPGLAYERLAHPGRAPQAAPRPRRRPPYITPSAGLIACAPRRRRVEAPEPPDQLRQLPG